jgi:hypothetical protein
LHQVATEQNDTIILLNIEPQEMLSKLRFHNCKLISHMLNPHNPHWRNVCRSQMSMLQWTMLYWQKKHCIWLIWFDFTTIHCESAHGNGLVRKLSLHLVQRKMRYAKGQKNSYKYKRPSTRRTTSSQHLSFLSFLSLASSSFHILSNYSLTHSSSPSSSTLPHPSSLKMFCLCISLMTHSLKKNSESNEL